MSQLNVALVATDDLEHSVTLSIEGRRIEYFLGDRYHYATEHIRKWLIAGWHNYAVSRTSHWASVIEVVGENEVKQRKKNMSTSIDSQKTPSKEYSFTVIAPQTIRNGLSYDGQRHWFKTAEDAKQFAADIFEGAEKKNFELCIVQCLDIVAPKPQIELSSRW